MESTSSLFNVLYPQKQGKIGVFLFSYHFSCFLTGCFLLKAKSSGTFHIRLARSYWRVLLNWRAQHGKKSRAFIRELEFLFECWGFYSRVAAFIRELGVLYESCRFYMRVGAFIREWEIYKRVTAFIRELGLLYGSCSFYTRVGAFIRELQPLYGSCSLYTRVAAFIREWEIYTRVAAL